MRFLRKAQSFRSPYLLRTLYRFVLASLNSNRPRFSHTSEKYGLQLVAMKLSLRPAGRQTLHTQWFQLSPSLGDAVQGRFVALWSVHLRPFMIAKRYVCAAKSFGAIFCIDIASPADSPNATCVQPARFLLSLLRPCRRSGPFAGHQTLRT